MATKIGNVIIEVSNEAVGRNVLGILKITNAEEEQKIYTVRPIAHTDEKETVTFLTTNFSSYLRDGFPIDEKIATYRVNSLIRRHFQGDPWSGYVLRNQEGALVGIWTVGHDAKKGDFNLTVQIKKEYQNQRLATALWKWTVECLFPQMQNQSSQAKVVPNENAYIRAITHPDHLAKVLEKIGFKAVKSFTVPAYKGAANDGRRISYEIALKDVIGQKS